MSASFENRSDLVSLDSSVASDLRGVWHVDEIEIWVVINDESVFVVFSDISPNKCEVFFNVLIHDHVVGMENFGKRCHLRV